MGDPFLFGTMNTRCLWVFFYSDCLLVDQGRELWSVDGAKIVSTRDTVIGDEAETSPSVPTRISVPSVSLKNVRRVQPPNLILVLTIYII